jgi:CRP-like cAMP-binding protein
MPRQIHDVERNIDLKSRLTAHPFLTGMSPRHVEVLVTSAAVKQFQKDEVIFRAGQPANGFYLIESGSVAIEGSVFEHSAISTDSVPAGEPLGWSWLFPPYLWHYDARAIKPTTVFFLDGAILHQACNEDLTLGHELFKRMSEVMVRRLQASRARLIEALKPAGDG